MEKAILVAIDETTNELLQTIALFNDEQFNRIPFEGSWTAGQVAEHIYKSEYGIPMVWQSRGVPAGRPADEKAATIRSIFLDFTIKMQSPGFILPTDEPKEQAVLYDTIKINRDSIASLAGSIDLNTLFPDIPFPQIGELTGLEWATFLVCHSKRHTRQLKNIYEYVK
ncbi:DinB family protein [Ferruginibacter sp.]